MATKTKNDPLEFYKGENRKLRSIVKALKKELARFSKRAHQYEEAELSEEDIAPIKMEQVGCPECGGKLNNSDLVVRTLVFCTQCKYRKSVKK